MASARSLAFAKELTPETTFLGAHVGPTGTDVADHVDLVTGPMLEDCAPHARWVGVYCEAGALDAEASRTVLSAGMKARLLSRIHTNQLGHGHGVDRGRPEVPFALSTWKGGPQVA